jgi:hypothetical protein
MSADPGQERPDEGSAFAEPEGVPKIIAEIVEEVAEAALASAQEEASRKLDEAQAFENRFTGEQCEVLRDLRRLFQSLLRPQPLLEAASHSTRPFPPRPPRIARVEAVTFASS